MARSPERYPQPHPTSRRFVRVEDRRQYEQWRQEEENIPPATFLDQLRAMYDGEKPARASLAPDSSTITDKQYPETGASMRYWNDRFKALERRR